MIFPDYFNFFKDDVLFLLFSFGLGCLVLWQSSRGKIPTIKDVFLVAGAIVIAGMNAWSDYESFSVLRQWSLLSPENIVSIRIEQSERLKPLEGKTVIFDDAFIIQRGVETLVSAQPDTTFYRALKDGYRLDFHVRNGDRMHHLYLSVYRVAFNDFTDVPVTIVIPHGVSRPDKRKAYSCPEFHEWLQKYIDPVFSSEIEGREESEAITP